MAVNEAGDSNRITRQYYDSLLIEMRHIGGVLPNTSLSLFGQTFSTPIASAAFSHLSKFGYHQDGMVELSKGMQKAKALNFVGMGSEEELERIIDTGAGVVKIIKPYEDNDLILRKIRHAEEKGVLAVGMDLDHSFNHQGEYDNIDGLKMRPKTEEELKAFVNATKLPFFIKGVLSRTDAEKCLSSGVKGLIVSHHHGIIRYAVPPLLALPDIAEVVNGRIPIFADCGIDTGYDVFKALALGATGACGGRAMLEPLKLGGQEAVAKWVLEQTGVLKSVMARTGSKDIYHIEKSLIRRLPPFEAIR